MTKSFGFECASCGQYHVGMPSFGWNYPVQYLAIPEPERERRVDLSSDACVIDETWFFVRGCLEMRRNDEVMGGVVLSKRRTLDTASSLIW